jgi:hypothetical protein
MSARKQKPLPEKLETPSAPIPPAGSRAPTIADLLAKIAAEVPEDQWDRLPVDLSENWDKHRTGR